jgi:hypothetical protein
MHTLVQIKNAMFGPLNSTVKLHIQDKAGNMYDVTAMRHLILQREGLDHSPRHIMQETGVRLRLPFLHLISSRSFTFSLPLLAVLPCLAALVNLSFSPHSLSLHRLDLSRSKAPRISAWRSRRAASQ